MAILNYANSLNEVLGSLGLSSIHELADRNKFPTSNAGNFVKLFFTGDGNIVTHGVNYLSLFTESAIGKGLVPTNTSGNIKEILRGDASWAEITTTDLPMWKTGELYSDDKLLSAAEIQKLFTANNAMRFKGVVTLDTIPTEWEIGDTYRVKEGGKYFNQLCEPGDLLVCIVTGNNGETDYENNWTVIQTNINGYTTIYINDKSYQLYSNNFIGEDYTIFGPTTRGGGDNETVLIGAKGDIGAPKWARLGDGLSINRINSTNNILSVNTASTTVLGGIRIDNTHGKGNTPTVSIDNGILYLTDQNIINALGYVPAAAAGLLDALTLASKDKKGLVPSFETIKTSIIETTKILGVTNDSDDLFGWYTLPEKAFTWRDIRIGTNSIGDATLSFKPTDDVYVKVDTDTDDGSYDISFGISWWNISANDGLGEFETA